MRKVRAILSVHYYPAFLGGGAACGAWVVPTVKEEDSAWLFFARFVGVWKTGRGRFATPAGWWASGCVLVALPASHTPGVAAKFRAAVDAANCPPASPPPSIGCFWAEALLADRGLLPTTDRPCDSLTPVLLLLAAGVWSLEKTSSRYQASSTPRASLRPAALPSARSSTVLIPFPPPPSLLLLVSLCGHSPAERLFQGSSRARAIIFPHPAGHSEPSLPTGLPPAAAHCCVVYLQVFLFQHCL